MIDKFNNPLYSKILHTRGTLDHVLELPCYVWQDNDGNIRVKLPPKDDMKAKPDNYRAPKQRLTHRQCDN